MYVGSDCHRIVFNRKRRMNESNFEIIGLMQLFGYIGNEWACCMCFRGRKSEHATWWVGVVMESDCVSVCACVLF